MEKDIGKLRKNDFTEVVIRIDDFGGKPGLTIREFVTGDRYTGFTKSGVKIPLSDFKKFKEMINSIKEEDFETSNANEASKEKGLEPKKSKNQETLNEFEDY